MTIFDVGAERDATHEGVGEDYRLRRGGGFPPLYLG